MKLSIIPALHRATHAVAISLEKAPKLGLSQAEAHILSQLLSEGDSTISALHSAFGHKRSTLTAILDRLEARKLVSRAADPEDRRAVLVHLTAHGKRSAGRALERLEALEHRALRSLTAAERAALRKGLDAFGK